MADVLAVRDEYRTQNWAMVIQECSNSGLSNREFCRQRGISEKTYYYWLRKLRNYYVACGYTDLRLGIDGLAAVVIWTRKVCSSSATAGRTGSRHCTGSGTDISCFTNGCPTGDFNGHGRNGAEVAGSPELPLAHGGTSYRAENSNPQGKTEGSLLSKKLEQCRKNSYLSVLYPAFML